MKVIHKLKLFAFMFLMLLFSFPLIAQSENESASGVRMGILVITLVITLIGVAVWYVRVKSKKDGESDKGFLKAMSGRATIEEEEKLILDHDYDGIKELNNKIPPWFMFLFYGTLLWGAIYMLDYHVIGSGNVQEEEYAEEVRLARLALEEINSDFEPMDGNNIFGTTDAASLARGKNVFIRLCAACHGLKGEGLVGPNFTDNYWVYGNRAKDLVKIIKYGVPTKGMVSWADQLDENQMYDVANYILTLRGTDPPNQKESEGALYTYE